MKISGRLRHTSTHTPATNATALSLESRSNASTSPNARERTIAIAAISRLIANPSSRKRTLLPVITHSQLSGSNR